MNAVRLSPTPANARAARSVYHRVAAGAVAAPLFGAAFTVIGAARSHYDWRRHAVSSLACGQQGWWQRANFIATGALWCTAAHGLRSAPARVAGSRLVPVIIGAAGVGLIGAGFFVTDPLGGFPPSEAATELGDGASPSPTPTRAGQLHNLSAIPVFAGIPMAGLAAAMTAARAGDYRWACYSTGASLGMVGNSVLFGAAFGGRPKLAGLGGLFQRLSIAFGFGWVTALCVRALHGLRRA